eukprot:CAMPEP_0197613764 /NCGR_PEP_ID=MMETSP1326-20131121/59184_1 /TAXON_ID=1155430 /ORGANISM="Genus nov. species nov., Strain RCC2288" /LENGTH=596 /DNA_ID=CAMNT_0043182629 /DNA_START=54 /DNA_END=1844 /DNA_ORIENTATION=+
MAAVDETKRVKAVKRSKSDDGAADAGTDEKAAKKAKKAAKAAGGGKDASAKKEKVAARKSSPDSIDDSPPTPRKMHSTDDLKALAKTSKSAKSAAAADSDDDECAPAGSAAAGDYASRSAAWLKEHEVTIHDAANKSRVCLEFASAPFPKALITLLMQQGFPEPSAVQGAAWPLAADGRDILAIAKTGSGKTLGFLLPALTTCAARKQAAQGTPVCLIMSPTRELALQITGEATKFGKALGCRSVAVYGGAPKWQQAGALQKGVELIVATPGRMMDMMDMHGNGGGPIVTLGSCAVLILDEADRMLDMGFEKDIRSIVAAMLPAAQRQTMLFTATWPKSVQRIASDILKADKVKVTVGSGGDKLTANKNVEQRVKVVSQTDKWNEFLKLVEPYKKGGASFGKRMMVFCNTKKDVNGIGQHLWQEGFSADTCSGDRSQREREDVIRAFRAGTTTMVVATDVAARGIDVTGVEAVINYDFPRDACDDYIHRIGRTGRAGASGVSETLFTKQDGRFAKELVRILKDANQQVSPELAELALSGGSGGGGGGYRGGGGRGRHSLGGGGREPVDDEAQRTRGGGGRGGGGRGGGGGGFAKRW